jgi:predicted transcriptional regulator
MPTSLKLSAALKARVLSAAKKAGKTPHAFMVEAIERHTEGAERRQRFVAAALAAEQEAMTSGKGYEAAEVHAAMKARAEAKRG